jgi:hypothetical protein
MVCYSMTLDLEHEFLNTKWQYLSGPTFKEKESRRFLYSDETQSEKLFNGCELQRHQFKQAVKNKNNNDQILKLRTELDEQLQQFEKFRAQYMDYLKKKHYSTINKYPFLREIIPIISPPLSEVISFANSQKSTTK